MSSVRQSLLAVATVLAMAHAGAATVKTGKPAASQAATAAWATRDQLRACLADEDGLRERFRAIDASTTAHEKVFDQVTAEGERLEQLHDQVDHDSDTSIKAFNALVKEHNQHVQQMNQDATALRPVSDAYNADMVAFNHRCSGLRYLIEDMEAVTRERRRAAAQATAAASSPAL